ncbi:MAG: hypothetical protein PQJ61_12100 [Spirochaetales bacterium]|uniref:Late embryogenesis abundant protein LEA-2 subgroup domain-containing protein n=1 Tax=Candidatus Thalassospirochaeta sargassi TaxID=3119039 RepID=A0AAJ1IDT9_9SPIO|nr:hypothetical protein [Spirochaetales bacterium]
MTRKLVGVLTLAIFIAGCSTVSDFFGKPEISFRDVSIDSLDAEGITFSCDYSVSNPYPVGIKIDGLSIDIIFEESIVLHVDTDEGLNLSSGAFNNNSILFKLPYESIVELAGEGRDREVLPFAISGEASFDLSSIPYFSGQDISIPFAKSFDVPVFKPEFSVGNGRIKLPSVREITTALVTGGVNILKAGIVAGQIVLGKNISGDVFDGIDFDVTVEFDLGVNNKGGAPWKFELDKCSINTGVGSLMEMKALGGPVIIESGNSTVRMAAVVNTLEWGDFITGLAGGGVTGSDLVIESRLSFPTLPYEFELPLHIEKDLSLNAFEFDSK